MNRYHNDIPSDQPVFCAGAARTDITPPLGSLINGDFVQHYARYIHDNLFARALVLHKGDQWIALVMLDMCIITREFGDILRTAIEKGTGIPAANITIACTHTHAAGSTASIHLAAADVPYMQSLPPRIVQAVAMAKEKIRPAMVAFGRTAAPGHAICRRYYMKPGYVSTNPVTGTPDRVKTNPAGAEAFIESPSTTIDTEIVFMGIRTTDGTWISVLANYSLHYVGDWDNGTISADYFGYFSAALRRELDADEDFIGIMSNGTSGEANIWDFLHPDRYPKGNFQKSELIGTDIARKVAEAAVHMQWVGNPGLEMVSLDIPLKTRKPSLAEMEIARTVTAVTDYARFDLRASDALYKLFSREQVLLNEYPDTIQFPIQVLKVGNGLIGTLAGEFFSETGLALKQTVAGRPYCTITLANGYYGYVPPLHELQRGGYESWRCRTSFLEEDAESLIRNRLTALLQSL